MSPCRPAYGVAGCFWLARAKLAGAVPLPAESHATRPCHSEAPHTPVHFSPCRPAGQEGDKPELKRAITDVGEVGAADVRICFTVCRAVLCAVACM